MHHPLNRAMRLIIEERPDRTATSELLAAELAARDLWRRPRDRRHPDPWDLEVWIRSEFGWHAFYMERGQVGLRDASPQIGALVA